MIVERYVLGPLQTNGWIVAGAQGEPVIIIDPADEPQVLLDALAGRQVAAIVLTHAHFDHLGAAGELVAATEAPLLVHEDDAEQITHPSGTGGALFGFEQHVAPPADRLLHAGDTVDAGSLSLRVLHTPGHTPGGISLFADGHVFSGDTVFAGSVGRTDFPGGDARALHESIVREFAPLPGETIVHPGHGPDTSIERERRLNPFFPRA